MIVVKDLRKAFGEVKAVNGVSFEAHDGQIQDQDFGVDVTVQARFPQDRYPAFEAALYEASNGRLEPIVVEEGEAIVPI